MPANLLKTSISGEFNNGLKKKWPLPDHGPRSLLMSQLMMVEIPPFRRSKMGGAHELELLNKPSVDEHGISTFQPASSRQNMSPLA